MQEAGLEDWVNVLSEYSQDAIGHACDSYLRDQPRRRPTPGDIRQRCAAFADHHRKRTKGDLTPEEMKVAEFAVAKGWLAYGQAQKAIIEGRTAQVPPWIRTETDFALYAVRHSEWNRERGEV